jgi:hypothetical protein
MILLSGKPKFLVARDQWRGDMTYHVCPCTKDDVIEIPKSAPSDCPKCGQKNIDDIFTAMDRKLRTSPMFLESIRAQEGPYGRYRMSRYDSRPYRLICSDYAMSFGHQVVWTGYDPIWTRDQLREWQATILLDVNPETGLVEDPFDIAENGRTDEVMYRQFMLSRYMVNAFRRNGFPDLYRVPDRQMQTMDMLRDKETALAFLEDRKYAADYQKTSTWRNDPYSRGSQVVRTLQVHRQCLKDAGLSEDGITEFVHRWLDDHQDPRTGYWGGEEACVNNGACGAFKILVAYRENNWPIPRPEKIIDTTLALADKNGGFGLDGGGVPSFGCSQFDPLMLLKNALDEKPEYRRQEVYHTTARSYLNVLRYWSDEEHFFLHPAQNYATLVSMMGMGTVMYMAEILLGVEILRPDR